MMSLITRYHLSIQDTGFLFKILHYLLYCTGKEHLSQNWYFAIKIQLSLIRAMLMYTKISGHISDHIQIMIKMPNPSQEPLVSSKAPNEDFKDMDVLCTFKIRIESPNLDHGCVKDQWFYPNEDKDAKTQSGTSSVLQSPKWGLKGHGCSLHLQNQDREPKFGSWVY